MYSRVGGGHLSAARALSAELEATGQFTTCLVDAYIECGRWPVNRFPAIYADLARHHPHLWWLIYQASSPRVNPRWIVGPFLRSGLRALVERERPDVILCVLPVVNGLLAEVKGSARVEVVLTDWHSVHPFWRAPGVDYYTAPTESARADCIRFGASADGIDVVGIPVRRDFARPPSASERAERLTALDLAPQRFTILAMAGAEGSPRALRNLGALAASGLDAQLVVVCGRSEDLRRQLARLPTRMTCKVLGFVDDVAGLMRSADVLVTKAGGLTLAEAFCCRIPVVVHDVLPGQEAGNLEYVLAEGAVLYARTPKRLVRTVVELSADPRRREMLANRAATLAHPDAARQIAANIVRRLEQQARL